MFEWLFPNWSNPAAIALIVGLRIGLNLAFVALIADGTGITDPFSVVTASLVVLSAAIMILALRPGVLGLQASYVELLVQLSILLLSGYTAYSNPSLARTLLTGLVIVGAIVLSLLMIPLYGEAFVAP